MTNDQNLLRTQLRNARKQLSALRRHLDSTRIATKLIRLIPQASTVASYVSTATEVSTRQLHKTLIKKGHKLLTPVVRPGHQLAFVASCVQPKQRNQYGIGEARFTPSRARKLAANTIFIVPLLGFDQQCHRIGMGGGYYDRLLARQGQHRSIGVAFQEQQLRSITTRPWDRALTRVVTPKRTFERLRQK